MGPLQTWLVRQVKDGQRRKGWSQVELAARAGISQKHLSQMLRGHVEGSLAVWDRLLVAVEAHPVPRR